MIESNVRVGGAVLFHAIGPNSSRPILKAGLEGIGWGKFVPEERTPFSCLQAALQQVFKKGKDSAKTLIRPLDEERGFAVVNEERGAEVNSYQHQSTWLLPEFDEHGNMLGHVKGVNGAEYESGADVREAFDNARLTLGPSAVGTALVKMIEALGGVALRPSGAIYWIAASKLDEWQKIVTAVEACSGELKCKDGRGPSNRLYVMRVMADQQMVQAVGDGIVNEITVEIERIKKELEEGLGDKAVKNRQAKVADMVNKVERFEHSFGDPLEQIRKLLDEANMQLAKASLLDTADVVRELEEAHA